MLLVMHTEDSRKDVLLEQNSMLSSKKLTVQGWHEYIAYQLMAFSSCIAVQF